MGVTGYFLFNKTVGLSDGTVPLNNNNQVGQTAAQSALLS